jgi:hypothetical protein
VMRPGLNLRASAMPMGFVCPGSLRVPEIRIDPVSKPAGLGSATHEALRPVVEGDGVPWSSIPSIAERWGLTADELRPMVALGAKLWPLVRDRFPNALTELALSCDIPGTDAQLTGHVDLIASAAPGVAEAGDWKTGHKDSDYRHQMIAYAVLVLADDASLHTVRVTVIWLREGEIEEYVVTRERAAAWLVELRERVIEWDGTYRPGGHCVHCPRSHECSAANLILRRDVAALLDTDGVSIDLANMPPRQIVSLYKQASVVSKLAENVREAIKAHVDASGGELASVDGRLVVQLEQRTSLDVIKAWPVLEAAGFGDEDFAAVVDIGAGRVRDLVARKAGKGRGAGAVRAINAALDEADAVRSTVFKKLVVKRGTGTDGE